MAFRDLTAKIKVVVDSSDALKSLGSTEKGFKAFSSNLIKAAGAITAAVGAVVLAFNQLREGSIKLAQERGLTIQLRETEDSLDSFTAKLDEVADATLSRAEQISSATKAILLGIAPEDTIKLLEIARASTVATGQSIEQAFRDISLGVGRQSRLILDNLGIIIKLDKAYRTFAQAAGKTVQQLTNVEQKQALLNEVLKKGAEDILPLQEGFVDTQIAASRMVAELSNIRDAFQKGLASSETLATALDAVSSAFFLVQQISTSSAEATTVQSVRNDLLISGLEKLNKFVADYRNELRAGVLAQNEAAASAKRLEARQSLLRGEFDLSTDAGRRLAEIVIVLGPAFGTLAERVREAERRMKEQEQAITNLEAVYKTLGATSVPQLIEAEITLETVLKQATKAFELGEIGIAEHERITLLAAAALKKLRDEFNKATTAAENHARSLDPLLIAYKRLGLITDQDLNTSLAASVSLLQQLEADFPAAASQTVEFERAVRALVGEQIELQEKLGLSTEATRVWGDRLLGTQEFVDQLARSTGVLRDGVDDLAGAYEGAIGPTDNLSTSTDNLGNRIDATTAANERLRESLRLSAQQAAITSAEFDRLERQEGRAAAEAAALAGGGTLELFGTRIALPGGGSRLVRSRNTSSIRISGGTFSS